MAQARALGAATFGSSSEFVPLQAADLIAYEVFKDMETKARGESRDMRYPLRRIVAGPQKIYNFDERSLKLALETEDFDH